MRDSDVAVEGTEVGIPDARTPSSLRWVGPMSLSAERYLTVCFGSTLTKGVFRGRTVYRDEV